MQPVDQKNNPLPICNAASKIPSFHAAYEELTGIQLRLTMDRERQWYEFIKSGVTLEDMRMLIKAIKVGINDPDRSMLGRRNIGALKFHNLIGQLDQTEEDLGLLRSLQRAKQRQPAPQPARDSVLRATGRPDTRETAAMAAQAKPAAELVCNVTESIAQGWAELKAKLAAAEPAQPQRPPIDERRRIANQPPTPKE